MFLVLSAPAPREMKSTKPVSPVHVRREGVQIHQDQEHALSTVAMVATVGMVRSDSFSYFLLEILNVFNWMYVLNISNPE